ncbi:MAG: transglutaminase domain-containing protein [Thermosynechococcaceae cyanobacterium]
MRRRWTLSWEYFQYLHVLAAILWVLGIFHLPSTSPSPIPYAAILHLLKCLPVGFFPLILAQTYCTNFLSLYRDRVFLSKAYGPQKTINLYYPYFGICLLAASATGGHTVLFLAMTAGLMAGLLGSMRSRRFSLEIFYSLIGLALILSLMGTHQVDWLQANFKFNSPDFFRDLFPKIASFSPEDNHRRIEDRYASDRRRQAAEETERMTHEVSPQAVPPTEPITPSQNPVSSQGIARSSPGTSSTQGAGASTSAPHPTQDNGASQSTAQSVETQAASQGIGTSPSVTPSPNNTPVAVVPPPHPPRGNSGNGSGARSSQGEPSAAQGTENANHTYPAPETMQLGGEPGQTNPIQSLPASNPNGANHPPSSLNPVQSTGDFVNPQTSLTQIGNRGVLQLSDAILFRVAPISDARSNRSVATFPLYIREATYNQYHAGAWRAVQAQFVSQASQTNPQRWILGSLSPNTTAVRISSNLSQRESLLKLPIGTSQIDHLAVEGMQVNQYGTVAVKGHPGALTYTAQFDPTQSLDSPPTQLDLAVPPIEQPTMQKILQLLDLKGKAEQETVKTIAAFFRQGFNYSLDLPQAQNNATPLATFLLDKHSGHCEFFASATSLLLRSAGIPTRYAVGYMVDEYSPSEQQYLVRARNAHAWAMAYVNGSWTKVDTTPGDGQPRNGMLGTLPEQEGSQAGHFEPSSEQKKSQSGAVNSGPGGRPPQNGNADPRQQEELSANGPMQTQSDPERDIKPTRSIPENVSDTWSSLVKTIKALSKKGSEMGARLLAQIPKHSDPILWSGALMALGCVIVLLSIFFAWIMGRYRYHSRRSKGWNKSVSQSSRQPLTDGLDSEFYILEKRLGEWGLERQSSETVRQWILRLKQKLPESKMNHLNQIIDLHYRYRFDPQGIAAEDRAKLKSMIQSWLLETTL